MFKGKMKWYDETKGLVSSNQKMEKISLCTVQVYLILMTPWKQIRTLSLR